MTEEEDKNKRIRPRERARGQKATYIHNPMMFSIRKNCHFKQVE